MGKGKAYEQKSIDYYSYISDLGNWNAVYKVIFSMGGLITVIGADSLWISLVTILFMLFLSVGVGRIPMKAYLRLMKIPAAFLLMGGAAIMVQIGRGHNSIFYISFFQTKLYITKDSLLLAVNVTLKALAAVSAFYMLTLSTPMGEIISVFRRLHVPALILELMHLIYRYIFILSETNQKQKDAAKSRLGYCDLKTSFHTFSSEMANLLVLSMKKADMYYDAMESRGYEGTGIFWEETKTVTGKQLMYGALYTLLLMLVFIVLRRNV
ncbi:MAG: cobalt ECF transporter T component CbiQ [Anaerocolumna aminovalerica]|uniref:cobalt ECF transporter T component CbiQ n=1 Tax=Anaerocolumna aminovalerica TaxID=1527 RepID=UPI002908F3DF|nr:cobalt ECF transporter T component CbiQ [Anaerocolumna aminovalerica]MDU6263342.1 cobalt ECF transporter T component CbiQ [Anaerocolumna aminovalerica]